MRFRDAKELWVSWYRKRPADYSVLASVGNVPSCSRYIQQSSMSAMADFRIPATAERLQLLRRQACIEPPLGHATTFDLY